MIRTTKVIIIVMFELIYLLHLTWYNTCVSMKETMRDCTNRVCCYHNFLSWINRNDKQSVCFKSNKYGLIAAMGKIMIRNKPTLCMVGIYSFSTSFCLIKEWIFSDI